jgi:hypothetical protein
MLNVGWEELSMLTPSPQKKQRQKLQETKPQDNKSRGEQRKNQRTTPI